jgi:APA family basic amino acid/polyamine antiporter
MTPRYGKLLRVLGVAFGWAVIVGNTIGAGILRAPGEVAQAVPSYPLFFLLWVVAGAYALLGALTLAELGAMIPESGGQTVFVRRAFGAYPGFAAAWGDWLGICASAAAITIVLVDSAVALVPRLTGSHSLLAALVIVGLAAGQWRGIKAGSGIQLVTSGLKAAAFVALIIACFVAPAPEHVATAARTVALPITAAGIVLGLQALIFTYDGWTGVLYFSGEVNDPGRDIPRATLTGVLSVTAIYLLLNAAFVRLIPLSAMAGDPMVADTTAQIVFGRGGTALIRLLIAVSLLSAVNANLLMGSRVLYATGARAVNAGGTPTAALAITTGISVAFLASGAFNRVIAMAAFFFVANYTASFAAVFWLRHKEPDTRRPFRAWGYPVTTGIVLAGSVAFLIAAVAADPRNSIYAIVLLAASYPIHHLLRRLMPELSMESQTT